MVSPVLSVVRKSHCAGHKITQIILIVYKNSCKVFNGDVYHQTGWRALIDICIYYISNCFVKTNLCSVSSKREHLDKMHLTKPWHGNEDDFTHHCLKDLFCSVADFGNKIQRNYFSTSHAKGRIRRHKFSSKTKGYPSSATSNSHIKKVPRRCKIIWMKNSLWPSASTYLSTTKSENLKKHLFLPFSHWWSLSKHEQT